ncbi:MAG: hypothetical protein ACK4NR_10695 [Micavibrio sp.]
MAYLDLFTEDEKLFLIRLPYRAGLWVSASDTTGGDESDDAEKMALANIVRGFTEDFLKSEFVEEVMRATVAHQDEWGGWNDDIDSIPQEVGDGIAIIANHIDYKQVHAFKSSLMDVAMTVAMAYREFDENAPFSMQMKIYSKYWVEVAKSYVLKTQPPIMEQYLNISQDEHKAIDALAASLRMDETEGLEPSEEGADGEDEDAA